MKIPSWQIEIQPIHANAMALVRKATGESAAYVVRQLVLEVDPSDWRLYSVPNIPEVDMPRNPRMRWKVQPGRIHHDAMMRLVVAADEEVAPIVRQLVLRRAEEILRLGAVS